MKQRWFGVVDWLKHGACVQVNWTVAAALASVSDVNIYHQRHHKLVMSTMTCHQLSTPSRQFTSSSSLHHAPPPTSVLTTFFHLNFGYLVYHWFSCSSCSGAELKSDEWHSLDVVLVAQPTVSKHWMNSENWSQPVKISHCLMRRWTAHGSDVDGRDVDVRC